MKDCIFCKIAKKEIPTEIVKETDNFVVFKDIKPSAPIHLLIVPKSHFDDMGVISDDLWAEVRKIAMGLAEKTKQSGYRLATNVGEAALVRHFHVHFMGGIRPERGL